MAPTEKLAVEPKHTVSLTGFVVIVTVLQSGGSLMALAGRFARNRAKPAPAKATPARTNRLTGFTRNLWLTMSLTSSVFIAIPVATMAVPSMRRQPVGRAALG
jgi:hypothetical protein